jgi:nicotinamide-nucleotide adenylyltransferase
MIEKTLNAEEIHNYSIHAIPDIHNPPQWVDHILSLLDDFSEVITNNKETAFLFKEKGFPVQQTGFFHKNKYSGKEIRRRMKQQHPWEDLVPSTVAQYLRNIDMEQRFKTL